MSNNHLTNIGHLIDQAEYCDTLHLDSDDMGAILKLLGFFRDGCPKDKGEETTTRPVPSLEKTKEEALQHVEELATFAGEVYAHVLKGLSKTAPECKGVETLAIDLTATLVDVVTDE